MSKVPHKVNHPHDGVQFIYKFPNNYGASVVQHSFSYGSEHGEQELAVIRFDGPHEFDLDYTTPITNDVIGYLSWERVEALIDEVEALPEKEEEV